MIEQRMIEQRISRSGQIKVYLGKCFRLFITEKQWKNFISAFIIIAIISLVTGSDMFKTYSATKSGVFAIVSACIWTGLFNSIRSVCRERDIIKREYRTGLHISSYLLAHTIYEMFLCGVESLIVLLFTAIRNITHLPPEGVVFPMLIDLYLTFFLVTFCSDMIALLVSCIVKSENTAMTVMPFILVVQLVMSGFIFKLEGLSEYISYLTASRWGVDAIMTIARTESSVDLAARLSDAGDAGSLPANWLKLVGFCIIYLVVAMIFLKRVDKDKR